jgi:glutathione peroxidase-family protein
MSSAARPANGQRRLRALATVPVIAVVTAAVLVTATGAGATAAPPLAPIPTLPLAPVPAAPGCQHAFVPAYFYAGSAWKQAMNSKPAPGVMILNVDSGVGTSPLPHFQALVRQARAKGITVLGYTSTEYGHRPAAAVETEIRHYRAWYGVTSMFLDLTAGTAAELPYYRKLARYIRTISPGSSIWLNPGAYPAQRYMSVGNVVMVFEGSYATYRQLRVPGWASHYRPARFAHVIYAAPASELARAISLSRTRRAGHLYVTSLRGSPNPYATLPGYWKREAAAIPARCPSTRQAPAASWFSRAIR